MTVPIIIGFLLGCVLYSSYLGLLGTHAGDDAVLIQTNITFVDVYKSQGAVLDVDATSRR